MPGANVCRMLSARVRVASVRAARSSDDERGAAQTIAAATISRSDRDQYCRTRRYLLARQLRAAVQRDQLDQERERRAPSPPSRCTRSVVAAPCRRWRADRRRSARAVPAARRRRESRASRCRTRGRRSRARVVDGSLPGLRTGEKPAPIRSATAAPKMKPRLSMPTTTSMP